MEATIQYDAEPVKINEISEKSSVKLSEEQISTKIKLAEDKIRSKINNLLKFKTDLQPQDSKEFLQILKSINFQYHCLNNYDINLDEIKRLRESNANILIFMRVIDVYFPFLHQLFQDVFDKDFSEEINDKLNLSIRNMLVLLFNYSDASPEFGDEICKRDKLINLYYNIIRKFKDKCMTDNLSKSHVEILKMCISTLYNTLLYDHSDNLTKIREKCFLDTIKDFMRCSQDKIRRAALLFTAYVADEHESKLFKSDTKSISYFIGLLKKSINTKFGRSQGLSTDELSKGIEKLSKNDENKQLLVDEGILPVVKMLLETNSIKLKNTALSILWSLAFDERNKKIIYQQFSSNIMEMKNLLSVSTRSPIPSYINNIIKSANETSPTTNKKTKAKLNPSANSNSSINQISKYSEMYDRTNDEENCLKNKLDGLTWTLQGGHNLYKKEKIKSLINTEVSLNEKHIMISYCWSNKEIVLKIYEELKANNYQLWIDKQNMSDKENIMESMALAVENSTLVIICISQHYKESASCRAEAQYALTRKKPIIPVMVQKNYRPDGWLGISIAGLQFCDFMGKYKFEDAFLLVKKQISRIQDKKEKIVDETDHVDPVRIDKETNSQQETSFVNKWTNIEIKNWFKEIGINKINWKDHYSGFELEFLQKISKTNGEFFYSICKSELQLNDLKDLRIFFQNLQTL